jgi:hypothetical protein
MKISNCKILLTVMFMALTVVSGGCRPSVQEVAKIISTVSLGASRDDVRKVLVEAYENQFPNSKQSYALVDPPRTVSEGLLKANRELYAGSKERGEYALTYPADLFDKMPPKAFFDMVGLPAETSEGNGSLSIYYDSNTNYIGFFACSTAKAH